MKKVCAGKFDEEMLPAIIEMNKIGLKTKASCSGHGKDAAHIVINMMDLVEVNMRGGDLIIRFNFKNKTVGEYLSGVTNDGRPARCLNRRTKELRGGE